MMALLALALALLAATPTAARPLLPGEQAISTRLQAPRMCHFDGQMCRVEPAVYAHLAAPATALERWGC